MSKQQSRIVDLSEFSGATSNASSSRIVDLSEFSQKKNPSQSEENMASSGTTSSTGGGFNVGYHSGMGVDLTKKAYSGLYTSDDDEESSGGFRAISTALKASIPNIGASLLGFLGSVTENVVNSAKDIKDFYTGQSSYSPGNFFENFKEQSFRAEKATRGKGIIESGEALIKLEQKTLKNPTSKESIAAPIYELASEMQKAGDLLFNASQKQWEIAPENQNKSILTLATEGNVGDAFKIAGLNVARSMPQSILLAATGGSTGVFAGAAISAGGAEVTRAYQQDGDVNAEDTYRAIGYGVVEGLSEMMFQGDLNALRSLGRKAIGLSDDAVKSSIKKLVSDEGKEAAKQTIVRSFLGGGIQATLKGAGEEGLEEMAAAVGSFGVDRIIDGKASPEEWNKLMNDVVDGFVVGAMSGGMMSGALAKASQVKLTETEKRSIARYKEIANDDTQSDNVREIAKYKIQEIKKYSVDKAYENYGLLSSIEDKTQRAAAIERAYSIQALEDYKSESKDVEIQKSLDGDIQYHKNELDKIFEQNYTNILSRTQQGQEAIGKLAQTNAEEFVSSNNLFGDYESNHQEALNKIDNKLEVDSKSLNEAANTLYGLQTQVEQNEQLSNTEKDIVLAQIDKQLNKVEGYQFATKNGELVSPTQNNDAFKSESKKRAERAKRLQNQRFDGEVIEITTPDGKKSKTVASVAANGEVELKPKRKFSKVSQDDIQIEEVVALGELTIESTQKDDSGNFVSATLSDAKTGNKLKVTNPNLIEFLSNKEAKQQASESANRQYSVDSNIMQAQNKILGKLTPQAKQRLANSYQALQSISPNAEVILYDNPSDMANGLVARGYSKTKASKAAKASNGLHHKGVIHLDISRMSDSTAAHEIFHEAVVTMANENPAEFQAMKEKIIKVLSDKNIDTLNKFLESYSEDSQAVQNEEFLAQLAGLMTTKDIQLDRPLMQKIAIAIRDFVASIADRLNSKSLKQYADSLFTEEASVEEVASFFEGLAKALREGNNVDTSYISEREEAPATTEDLSTQDPYSEGLPVEVPSESFRASKPILKSERIGKYTFPAGAAFESIGLPSKSLDEIIKQYEGRVVIITSDATGYGVDSLGQPILGGFGFSTIKQNIDDNIGFASVGESEVKSTMTRARNIHGNGKAVVLIMIQPAFTTIGNSYGVKYFARGMREIAQKDAAQLEQLKVSMKEAILNSKDVSAELEKVDEKSGKRNTEEALFKLIDSINKDTDIEAFTKEFLKDTTFKSRTGIINMFLIDSQNVGSNVAAHPLKVALKEIGYSKVDFLKEYGDTSFLTQEMIESNAGGFVVGGFEIDIKSKKDMDAEIAELQSKGIEHPLFNGKLGGTNHFVLDGLYDVNDNFAEFAVPQSEITLPNEERDALVRETYTEDKFYESEFRNLPLAERTYTQLKPNYRIKFKDEVIKPLNGLTYNTANVAASVARSLGFNLDESKRDDLRKSEFKQRQKDTLRQQKTVEYEKIKDKIFGGLPANQNRLFFADIAKEAEVRGDSRADIVLMFDKASMWLSEGAEGYVTLDDFQVYDDAIGTGKGSSSLNKLLEYADSNEITILADIVSPELRNRFSGRKTTTKGLTQKQLIDFYKKRGFKKISKKSLADNPSVENEYYERTPAELRQQKSAPAINKVFEVNPELTNIGSRQQYLDYLDTVFPDSQVKDIVYHGSETKKPTDIFVETFIGKNNKLLGAGKGFYFTKDVNYSKVYGETTSSLIDIKNPTDFNSNDFDTVQELEAAAKGLSDKGDGVIDSRENFYYPKGEENVKLSSSPDYIVFKPEQIHILGSKQDVAGFKNFVNKEGKQNPLRQQVTLPSIMQDNNDGLDAARRASFNTVWNGIVKALFERNINVKKSFEQSDFEYALYAMYNKAGASNFGTLKFAERYKEIYEGISKNNRKNLDDIIFLRRVIAIDNNRTNQRADLSNKITSLKGILAETTNANDVKSIKKQIADLQKQLKDLPNVLHTEHTDYVTKKKVATNKASAKKTLADIERLLGKEIYDAFYSRSDSYFKAFSDILKYKFENGIIDEATYNLYKDYNYSPRQFMQFMYGIQNNELSGVTINSFNSRGSLVNKKDIVKITGGSDNFIELDSEKLLHAAMISAEVKVATNKATKVLNDEMLTANYDWIKEANYDRYSDGTIKMNPDGSPKILAANNEGKNDAFRNMYYKIDGKSYAFQMRNDLAAEFYDEQLFDRSNIYYKIISNSTGAAIVRAIATGWNIAFPISNIPIDIISQVHLNDIYAGGIAGQYKQAIAGTLNLAEELIKSEFKLGDNTEVNNLIVEYGQAGGLMMTQTMEGSLGGKVGEALGMLGNISELASKLNAYKTMRDTMIEEYYQKNGVNALEKDLEKIKSKAAFKARAAMDYHRGGLATKWLDGFIPYLNVLTQVNKITTEYIVKNPKEFVKKIGTVGSALAAITIYNLMVASDDYDNDDVQNDLLKNIVIFHPFKNADGTRGYTKIAVPNTVKGFLNIFQNQAEGIYYRSVDGKEKELEAWKADRLQKSLSVLLPSRSSFLPPAYKAYSEYTNNIDLWRKRPVYNGPKVEEFQEGANDKRVTEFLKVLAAATSTTTNVRGTEYKTGGISPIRAQKALEDILPPSNPLVQMGYSLMDKSINTFSIGNLKPEQRSKFETGNLTDIPMSFLGAIKNRAVDVTDPKISFKNSLAESFDVIQKSENYKYQVVKKQISLAVESGKSFNAIGKIVNENGQEYLNGAVKYYTFLNSKKTINYPQFENEYSQIMFEKSPVSQGKMIYQLNQDLLAPNKSQESVKLLKDLITLKMWDKSVIPYYLEAYNNEQKSIKR